MKEDRREGVALQPIPLLSRSSETFTPRGEMRFHVRVVQRRMNYRLEGAGDVGTQHRPDRRPKCG